MKKEFGLDADAIKMGTLIAFAGLDYGTVALRPIGVAHATRVAADKNGIRDIADLSDEKKTAVLERDGPGELWIGTPTWSSTDIERIRANSCGYAKTLTLLAVQEDVGMDGVDPANATERPTMFACCAPRAMSKLYNRRSGRRSSSSAANGAYPCGF